MRASLRQYLQKALDLYDEKKCRSSIPEFDDVLQFMPKLPDATRLCASAVECLDNEFFVDKISSRVGATHCLVYRRKCWRTASPAATMQVSTRSTRLAVRDRSSSPLSCNSECHFWSKTGRG